MNKKKDKKKFYKNYTIKNKRNEELNDLLKGVLITTDKNKEKNSVRDAYNILNDAIEQLYPNLSVIINEKRQVDKINNIEDEENLKSTKKQKTSETTSHITKKENVSDLLENEINILKKEKYFYNFDTNCKGVIFIKIEKNVKDIIDIKKIVYHIIDNIKNKKEQISKSIARFIPIELAIKAKVENFAKYAPFVLDKYFKKESNENLSWKLEFKCRNNCGVKKNEYLQFLWDYIDKNSYHVDIKNPHYTIILEITNDLLCLSVLENYEENKLYNLLTLSKSEEELILEREKKTALQKFKEEEKLKKIEINKDNHLNENIKNENSDIGINSDEDIEII